MSQQSNIVYNEIDFLIPSYRFKISYSYVSKRGLSFIREFVLRLVHLSPMKPCDISEFLGLTEREAKEEANLKLQLKKLYGTYSIPEIGQVLFVYIGKIMNENFRAADETAEVNLFSISNIPWDLIAFPSVEFFLRNYTKDFLNGKKFSFHSNFLQ